MGVLRQGLSLALSFVPFILYALNYRGRGVQLSALNELEQAAFETGSTIPFRRTLAEQQQCLALLSARKTRITRPADVAGAPYIGLAAANVNTTVPIFVLTHDRLTVLKQALWSFHKCICTPYEVVIHDFNSTFPETVQFIEALERRGVMVNRVSNDVLRLSSDGLLTVRATFSEYLRRHPKTLFYAVTDPDIALETDVCTGNILQVYASVLLSDPNLLAVGPAFHLDDIPESYPGKQTALDAWKYQGKVDQKKNVRRVNYVLNDNVMPSVTLLIDTTFSLRRASVRYSRPSPNTRSIRMFSPYACRHLDWYINPLEMRDDQVYYARHSLATTSNYGAKILLRRGFKHLDERMAFLLEDLTFPMNSRAVVNGVIQASRAASGEVDTKQRISINPNDHAQRKILLSIEAVQWHPQLFYIIPHLLRRRDSVFVDASAWIGVVPLFAARHSRVVALEVSPVAHDSLRYNCAINPSLCGGITAHMGLLCQSEGAVPVATYPSVAEQGAPSVREMGKCFTWGDLGMNTSTAKASLHLSTPSPAIAKRWLDAVRALPPGKRPANILYQWFPTAADRSQSTYVCELVRMYTRCYHLARMTAWTDVEACGIKIVEQREYVWCKQPRL